ncbi:POGK protein, partial [Probosciger aterrimus]|nr:POGK protein [Probosciger aterrimus]
QHLPFRLHQKFITFQKYVIRSHKGHDYLLSQMGNADETPAQNPSSSKLWLFKNEKMCIIVMLAVVADGIKLPPYVILKQKTILKDQLPTGIIVRCQNQGWMSSDLMKDCLYIIWNRRPGVLVCKRRMLALDTFKGYLISAMKNMIGEMNAALAVVPGGMS